MKRNPDKFDYMSRRVMDHLIATAYILDRMHEPFRSGGIVALEEFYCRMSKGKFFDWEEFKAKDKGKHAPEDVNWTRPPSTSEGATHPLSTRSLAEAANYSGRHRVSTPNDASSNLAECSTNCVQPSEPPAGAGPQPEVPAIWRIDRCPAHKDYIAECPRCQEEVLTYKLEKAFIAGWKAGRATPVSTEEGRLREALEHAKELSEWLSTALTYMNRNVYDGAMKAMKSYHQWKNALAPAVAETQEGAK